MPATSSIYLGACLPTVEDWGGTNLFANLMKSSRHLSSFADPAEIPAVIRLDANGHPVEPFGMVVKAPLRAGDAGEYQLKFKGKARAGALPNVITVRNQRQEGAWQIADVIIPDEALSTLPNYKEPILMLRFDDLQNESVSDISLVKKSLLLPDGSAPTFHPVWIDHLKRFKLLRFLAWMCYRGPNTPINWADRASVDAWTQIPGKIPGVAPEYIVELARAVDCDVWINIHPCATDDYIEGLANFLKAGLPAAAKIYLEYGNEIWSAGDEGDATWQGNYNYRMTVEEIAAGNSNLKRKGETEAEHISRWAMRRYARRTKEAGDIFASVFREPTRAGRIRPVYCYQSVNPDFSLTPGLDFLESEFGSVAGTIWGISPKTCVDEGFIDKPKAEITADDILENMHEGLGAVIGGYPALESQTPILEASAATAAWHNIGFAVYEGGIGFVNARNLPSAVVFDMMKNNWEIQNICSQYLQAWFSYGNDNPMCWFMAGITDWGGTPMFDEPCIWGLTWSIEEQNTLPITAIDEALARGGYEFTAGISVPGKVDLRKHTNRRANWERTVRHHRGGGSNNDLYLVNAPASKLYTCRLVSEKNVDFPTSVELWMNKKIVSRILIPQGRGSHRSEAFLLQLRKGLNAMRLDYSDHALGDYYLEVK